MGMNFLEDAFDLPRQELGKQRAVKSTAALSLLRAPGAESVCPG